MRMLGAPSVMANDKVRASCLSGRLLETVPLALGLPGLPKSRRPASTLETTRGPRIGTGSFDHERSLKRPCSMGLLNAKLRPPLVDLRRGSLLESAGGSSSIIFFSFYCMSAIGNE